MLLCTRSFPAILSVGSHTEHFACRYAGVQYSSDDGHRLLEPAMSIIVNYAALTILAITAVGLLVWAGLSYRAGLVRQRFWKRAGCALLLLALLSPAFVGDWTDRWGGIRSEEHQQTYLLGLLSGFLVALACMLLEPVWRMARVKLLTILAAVLATFLILAANTRQAETFAELVFHSATFSGTLFVIGLIGLIWRIAIAREFVPDDGYSRLLRR